MAEENYKNVAATDEELAAIHAESSLKLAEWKATHKPPDPEASQRASIQAAEYTAGELEKAKKFKSAKILYADLYDKNKEVWNKGFDARVDEVLKILESKGVTFTDEEKIKLRISLEASTVTMKFDEDSGDVPIYPAS